jgi:hypothetical protein
VGPFIHIRHKARAVTGRRLGPFMYEAASKDHSCISQETGTIKVLCRGCMFQVLCMRLCPFMYSTNVFGSYVEGMGSMMQ